ncbi:MAG: hypothetical protein P8127_07250 [Acidobacteriota bacterium]
MTLICGRYEGFDERVFEIGEVEEVSVGDYILGGGEVAAMVLIEAVARLVPGVVGDLESVHADSYQTTRTRKGELGPISGGSPGTRAPVCSGPRVEGRRRMMIYWKTRI